MEDRIVLMIGRARLAMGFLALASACSGATTATGTGGNPSLGAGTAGAGNTGGSTGAGGLAGGGGSGGSGTTTSGGGAGGGPVAGASGTNGGNGGASGAGGTSVGRGGAGGLNTGTGGSGGAVGGSGAGGATAAGGASGSFPGQTCLSRADGLVAQMTANEKYGQMLQMERQGLTAQDVTQYFLGSAFSQGGSAPSTNSAAGWADMTDAYRQGALATRLKIPFLYGADEVHGVSTVQGATIFPHNIGLGASRDAALVEQIGRTASDEGRGCGVDFFFSPVVAVALDERWGRTYEAYGETSDLASTMGVAMTKGIQFSATGAFTGILANAKHYLGDGGTAGGVTGGNTAGDETKLRAIHLAPYQAVVDARVGSIMPSYSSWQGVKMHINKTMITDVLKGQLGFGGFIVSDFNACFQLGLSNQAGIEQCTNAGVDMFMAQGLNVSDMVGYLATAVKNGNVPQSRIDDAVRRIVAVKCELGLFEATGKVDRSLTTNVGSADHRALARKAVQESLVVLKNDGNVLPLAKTATVALAGKSADNTGNQCGGWTITWQGGTGNIVPGATSVRQAFASVLDASHLVYSANGSTTTGASVGVAVIGETPYSEGCGDIPNPQGGTSCISRPTTLEVDSADVAVVQKMKTAGLKTVVVLVTGRPLMLDQILPIADAIVVAWLPGSEAGGITDILYGDAHPTGKLPQTWPRSMSQIPINYGDATYDPLYAYGYGLTY